MSSLRLRESAQSPEACFNATTALCNTCGRLSEAKTVFRGGRVYLVKWCPEHGRSEALVCSDQRWFVNSQAFIKPGTRPLERARDTFAGCPRSCGLCPEHQQHTCVPLLEITGSCDLACPICLVGARPRHQLSVEEVRRTVETLLRYEGAINMLTLSGGEPTCHPQLLEIVDALRRPEIGIVSLSTNGLRLAAEPDLVRALCERDVVFSLQLDGFTPETSLALRGRGDLPELKQRAIDTILSCGGRLSLTVTLARGVNEHELEAILALFLAHDEILSLMVQPLAHTERAQARYAFDPLDVVTIPDVVALLAAGSRGALEPTDFTPLPCSHPSCFALTYLLKTAGGRIVPLPRLIEAESYLDIIKNQALFNTDAESLLRVRDALYALWSSDGVVPDREAVLGRIRQILLDLNRLGPTAPNKEVIALGAAHVKSIFIHHFMDRYTFDLSRAAKCCNHYPQRDGRLLPACVRNNVDPLVSGC